MSTGIIKAFYNSPKWAVFRAQKIQHSIQEKGGVFCEYCGKPIVEKGDICVHHTPIELTPENVNDVMVALNEDNTKIACKDCHNKQHNRWCGGRIEKKQCSTFIVYGAPMSGKSSYVTQHYQRGDIVVDMDRLFHAVTLGQLYDKPDNLLKNIYAMQNLLIDNIKTHYGSFKNAWIIGGYPEKFRRNKLAEDLGAELVFIPCDLDTCLYRLQYCNDYRQQHAADWELYIRDWFQKFQP